ncbi:O-antigen ligase family protein [Achromobacter ruhlandii]|uniref:O-antigen ligase family protein n=1 Tax=Achromobacter ruhlandii TaxID=72557 RepID=UPI003BA09939
MPISCLRSVVALALLIPALALTSAVGGTIIIYLTALIALTTMAFNLIRKWEPFSLKEITPIAVVLVLPMAAMCISSTYLGVWSSSEIEKLLRFALAVPVCWVLMRAPRQWLQQIQWSLLVAAFAGSLMLIYIIHAPGLGRGAVSDFGGRYNAVAFADLTIFFGLASLLTLRWNLSPWPRLESAAKIAVMPICLYGVWVSQTRSSWLLLPVFGLVYLLTNRQWVLRTKMLFLSGFVVVIAAVAAVSWYSTESRWRGVVSDLNSYEQQDRDTSVGIRIQLWKASWMMFKESPLLGVGVSNFRPELAKLQKQGVVTELVSIDYGEPHNDMLSALAGYGVLGLLSILALYLIPAAIFWRRSASDDPVVHVGLQIGLLFCLGYFVFSMSEMMFRNMRSVPIYALTVVVLYALTSARTGLAQQRLAARR